MKNLRITVEGKTYEVQVELLDEDTEMAPAPRRSSSGGARLANPVQKAAPAPKAAPVAAGEGGIASPLSAVVVSVDVAVGDAVEEGQKVVTLEAMKMNTIVSATTAGSVKAIHVSAGDGVEEGQLLIEIA